jgi:UDP-N-acetylmuramyl pentapeptide phosphotransferase/UDP-N-acetylglucosamine-1-phosphate transferase
MITMTDPGPEILALLALAAAAISAMLIILLHPLLVRYALARPNARSSHRTPTPQGGGIAVIAATMIVLAGAAAWVPSEFTNSLALAVLFVCAAALAVVGAIDDIRPLEPLPRLLLQALAVAVVVAILPARGQIISILPWWIELALLFVALLWFVNLVNFMDGIDWMTEVEVVPITAAIALFGLIGTLPGNAALVAAALGGAMIGFAPFNRPVARLFLGDVGSLPIGLLLGWLLVLLAGGGHLAAALLLPLYYVADSTITLLRRLVKGEQIIKAHRSHFYQRATDGGHSVYNIIGRVFALNCALVMLATATVLTSSLLLQTVAVAIGCVLVSVLLRQFARGKR